MAKIPAKIPARIGMTIHVCRLISTFATMKATTENSIDDSMPGVNETRGEDIDGWLNLNKFSQKLVRIIEVAKIASPFIPNLRKKIS